MRIRSQGAARTFAVKRRQWNEEARRNGINKYDMLVVVVVLRMTKFVSSPVHLRDLNRFLATAHSTRTLARAPRATDGPPPVSEDRRRRDAGKYVSSPEEQLI